MKDSCAQSRPSGEIGVSFGLSNPITPAGMSMVKIEPLYGGGTAPRLAMAWQKRSRA